MPNATKESKEKVEEIIKKIEKEKSFSHIDVKTFALPKEENGWADIIAYNLGRKMKTAQLRKVFDSLKQMEQKVRGRKDEEEFNDPKLYMILPHLAYAKGRGLITSEFYNLIKTIIPEKIKTIGDFKKFCDFMTAIVAYHKQYSK